MAQRYASPRALERMSVNLCPECGAPPSEHLNDNRFWIPRNCDLTQHGVTDRIEQYVSDTAAKLEEEK